MARLTWLSTKPFIQALSPDAVLTRPQRIVEIPRLAFFHGHRERRHLLRRHVPLSNLQLRQTSKCQQTERRAI